MNNVLVVMMTRAVCMSVCMLIRSRLSDGNNFDAEMQGVSSHLVVEIHSNKVILNLYN